MSQNETKFVLKTPSNARNRTFFPKISRGAYPRPRWHNFTPLALDFAPLELNFAKPIKKTWSRLRLWKQEIVLTTLCGKGDNAGFQHFLLSPTIIVSKSFQFFRATCSTTSHLFLSKRTLLFLCCTK